LGQALGKSGLRPAFSPKFKVAFPKLKFWESLTYHQENLTTKAHRTSGSQAEKERKQDD
jgi:hypothetical protein